MEALYLKCESSKELMGYRTEALEFHLGHMRSELLEFWELC